MLQTVDNPGEFAAAQRKAERFFRQKRRRQAQPVSFFCQVASFRIFSFLNPNRNPAKRIRFGSEEKARSAYEKALRPFHRLRAFSELESMNTFEAPISGLHPKPNHNPAKRL
ncbi:MAG: hypothetical protein J6J99_06355 [Oscillibacter sp.]|nr:hypothetical protein [Oscillibacter sp.]